MRRPALKSKRVTDAKKAQNGVAYFLPKVLVQLVADLQTQRITNRLTTNTQPTFSPNEAPVFYIPFKRAAFATVSSAVTFTNGFLSSVDYSKTSEIEGFVSIPFELSKMALSVPTNLIQLKIDLATRNADLIKQQQTLSDNQAGLLNSVSNLLQRQQAFEEFMRTNKPH